MSQFIAAIFDAGVFRPLEPVQLADGTRVQVQVPESSDERRHDDATPPAATIAWPDFIQQTYGSCAGLGLERPEQGDFELREPIA